MRRGFVLKSLTQLSTNIDIISYESFIIEFSDILSSSMIYYRLYPLYYRVHPKYYRLPSSPSPNPHDLHFPCFQTRINNYPKVRVQHTLLNPPFDIAIPSHTLLKIIQNTGILLHFPQFLLIFIKKLSTNSAMNSTGFPYDFTM